MEKTDNMTDARDTLEFRDVVLRATSGLTMAISGVSLKVCAGELCVIAVKGHEHGIANPLFDLAEGMTSPDEGSVVFMGQNWQDMRPSEQSKMRGRIGRAFETQGWISNLSVRENIRLAQRHHTRRSDEDMDQEIKRLCRSAGLDAEPEQRPEFADKSELQKSQWIRAFLGNPVLVLLEHPDAGVPAESVERLVGMTDEALGRGAAVVWMTPVEKVRSNKRLADSKRLYLSDGKFVSVMED